MPVILHFSPLTAHRPLPPIRYRMHRSIHISSVYRDIPFFATVQHGWRRETELIVIAAAANNSYRTKRVQKFFAARVSAAVVTCDKKRSHPAIECRNNQVFGDPAGIAGQDHPGLPKRYLEYKRDNLHGVLLMISTIYQAHRRK